MEMSENINELAKALSAAQGELPNAVCNAKGHGYDYAKLIQYNELAKPILPKHGLSVCQLVGSVDMSSSSLSNAYGVTVTTILMHSSGQWIKTYAVVPQAVLGGQAGKNPVQLAGCQVTYMRRYQYAGILGMTDSAEDNDAQGLLAPSRPPQPKPAPQQVLAPMPDDMFDGKKAEWVDGLWSAKYAFPQLAAKARAAGFVFTQAQVDELTSEQQDRNTTLEEMA